MVACAQEVAPASFLIELSSFWWWHRHRCGEWAVRWRCVGPDL